VVWPTPNGEKRQPCGSEKAEVFVGLASSGKNFVWKSLDTDPTLFLNFFHKAKSAQQSIPVLAR
jgi:hypothetical protein